MTTPLPRFNFRFSGDKIKGAVSTRLLEGLARLEELPGVSDVSTEFASTEAGWEITGSGYGESPEAHAAALTTIRDLAAGAEVRTGSSEFASPYMSAAGYHTAPAEVGEDAAAPGEPE